MDLLLGIGLIILGGMLIGGVLLIGSKGEEQASKSYSQKISLSDTLRLESVNIVSELEKQMRGRNNDAIDGVVDVLETYSSQKKGLIHKFLIDTGVIERYKTELTDIDYKVRSKSAERLGKLGGSGIAEMLFRAMADKNEEARLAATSALKRLGDTSISGNLVRALKEPNKWLPARIAEVLVSMGKAAVPQLIAGLKDNDLVYKGYIIEILGEIGEKSSASSLFELTHDKNSNIRLQAARALGAIGDYNAVDLLAELLQDNEVKVRIQSIISMGRIGGSKAAAYLAETTLNPDAVVRYTALEALRQMGAEGTPVLEMAATNDNHPAAEKAREILNKENSYR